MNLIYCVTVEVEKLPLRKYRTTLTREVHVYV